MVSRAFTKRLVIWVWANKAEMALEWLIENQSKGYSGACWGNHFDYQSRGFYLRKGVPTIVWTSLIGHAFLDGYEHFKNDQYLQIAVSACEHILRDYEMYSHEDGLCISYVPGLNSEVHNANTLGASLLVRTGSYTHNQAYTALAQKAFQYTAQHQRSDGSWYYAEYPNSHWVDNFHTGYVLDCFKRYLEVTGDDRFTATMNTGYEYWKNTFFLPRWNSLDITTTKHFPLTSSAVPKRSILLSFSATAIRKTYLLR